MPATLTMSIAMCHPFKCETVAQLLLAVDQPEGARKSLLLVNVAIKMTFSQEKNGVVPTMSSLFEVFDVVNYVDRSL